MAAEMEKRRSTIHWTKGHDLLLLREMLLQEPWKCKCGSPERGNIWENISSALNSVKETSFKVSQRSVRDRYGLLEKRLKKKRPDLSAQLAV
eukprot:gene1420-1572_t